MWRKENIFRIHQIRSDQISRSVVSDSLRPHESQHARPPCPSPTPRVHWDRLTSIESVMPSSRLILCCLLFLLPSIPPSIRIFSNESTLRMRWPKYWSFSLGIIPSKEIPGLISFRMDWLDLLAVQGTLKNLLQHHSSKASIRWHSAFFSNQCKEIEENNRMGKTRDLFKKIRDTKGTFHAKMGSIKDRNGMDLTEAEDIKKRWQEYTEELTKKIFTTQIITMVWSLT